MLLVSCIVVAVRMWFGKYKCHTVLIFVLLSNGCEGVSNVNFNEQIRDYSVNSNVNLTNVKTLQKEDIGLARYASFPPHQSANGLQSKDVPDNVLSGSSHGRGLLHHDLNGYGLYEYEDPHFGYGHEVPHDTNHHVPHNYHPYGFHDEHQYTGHHVVGYGHRHKHLDHHALAAKALLWPIAGIALLGAAAALVSNPVLLQLGVVSGRKKRQVENLDFVKDSIKKWSNSATNGVEKVQNVPEFLVKRRFIQNDSKVNSTGQTKDEEEVSKLKMHKVLSRRYYTNEDEAKLIPVALKFRKPKF